VVTILSVPLCHDTEDFVAWHFDSRGVFTVKSAYKVHVELEKQASIKQDGEGSNILPLNQEVFKKLWKVQCPPKVHHFLWRMAHNSHPLYMNIARRGVDLDTRCVVCHRYFEDGGHLFLNCKLAKQRWRAIDLEDVRLKLRPCSSAVEVLQEVFNLTEKEKLLAISFLWNWWSERNRGNHGERYQSIDQFQYTVRRHVNEWETYLKKKTEQKHPLNCHWTTPPPDTVKINIDASFQESTRSGGWGVIARDSSNDMCFAIAGPLKMMKDAFHAEATALSHAIQAADQMGVGRVIFETDSINLKYAMTTSDYDLSPIGALITDMKYRLHMNFTEASVVHTPRLCNKPAHVLAALGVGIAHTDHVLWTSSYPTDVTRSVTGDSTVS
jgi:hypothetical protein